ncbi:MAG: MMPL family transporter [Acidobacteria bacterium]|nr:MMPL family transporter [Acidobacteriota bacterium]
MRHARAVLVLSLVLCAVALGLLIPNISVETDITHIFPEGHPQVDAFRSFLREFGQVEPSFVVYEDLDDLDPDDVTNWFIELDTVKDAYAGPDLDAFLPIIEAICHRPGLFLDESAWADYSASLSDDELAIRFQQLLEKLGGFTAQEEVTLLKLDPTGVLRHVHFEPGSSGPLKEIDGYYYTPNGEKRVLMLVPHQSAFEGAFAQRYIDDLDRVMRAFPAEAEAYYFSGHLYAVSDAQGIRSGITRTLFASLLLLIGLFRWAYGRWSAFFVPLPAVMWGVVAASTVLVLRGTSINILTASFASVVMGLGVDAAVHMMSVVDWKENGARERYRSLIRPLMAAMLTTVCAFASLLLVDLPVMRELGLLCGVGVAVAQLSSFILVPVGQVVFGIRPAIAKHASFVSRLVAWAESVPSRKGWMMAGGFALLAVPVWRIHFQADLRELRHKTPELEASENAFARDFAGLPETVYWYVSAHDYPSLYARVESSRAQLLKLGVTPTPDPRLVLPNPDAPKRDLTVPMDHWPRGLNQNAFSWPSGDNDWRSLLTDADYQQAMSLMLRQSEDALSFGQRFTFTGQLPGQPLDSGVLTSVPQLQEALVVLLKHSFREVVLVLAPILVLVLWLGLKRLRFVVRVALALLLAVLMTLGLLVLSGGSLSLANLAVVPLLLGIGIDDAIHMAVWFDHEDRLKHWQASAHGILMTSLSTMIGFGSLALAPYPALQQMGLLVDLGLLACLFVTVVFIPLVSRRRP